MSTERKITPADAQMARDLISRFGDTPLSELVRPTIKMFSQETMRNLQTSGNTIYELAGQSVASFKKPRSRWDNVATPDLKAQVSRLTQVAFEPDRMFIPDSDKMTMKEQEEMLKEESEKLQLEIPGATLEWPEIGDLVEMSALTGNQLFEGRTVRTNTAREGLVYHFRDAVNEPQIYLSNPLDRYQAVFAPRIIVPTEV